MPGEDARRLLGRHELAHCAEQTFGTLSGGQQARFQILLLELSGANLLLLDEPTDNLDLISAATLHALETFDGTVLAVTHDRWFATRSFNRFLIFGTDGQLRGQLRKAPNPMGRKAAPPVRSSGNAALSGTYD